MFSGAKRWRSRVEQSPVLKWQDLALYCYGRVKSSIATVRFSLVLLSLVLQ